MSFKWSLLFPKSLDATTTTTTTGAIHSLLERSSHTINFIHNKILVYGGENQPRMPIDDNIVAYDLTTHAWSIADVVNSDKKPCARIGHASCVLGSKLYVFGGRTGVDMGESSLNDLHAYDVNTKTWSQLSANLSSQTHPAPRSFSLSELSGAVFSDSVVTYFLQQSRHLQRHHLLVVLL